MMIHDVSHASPELEEGVGEGVGVARPLGVVEQDYFSLLLILQSKKRNFLKNEPFPAFFLYFRLFLTVDSKQYSI